jgi:antitoxin component of MazEF toxin-antitoxin module
MLQTTAVVAKWGNCHALRLSAEVVQHLGVHVNDKVALKVGADTLTITKPPVPREGTIEYLFRDYSDESFQTELSNPTEPVGAEKW